MTPTQERWGAASMLVRQHGERAGEYAAERILHFSTEGDDGGVRCWQEIAANVGALLRPASVQ